MNRSVLWGFLISICLTLFIGDVVRHNYYVYLDEICTKMEVTFNDAIEQERQEFHSMERVISFQNTKSSDTISVEERAMFHDQERMIKRDPDRLFLDSLFRLKIVEQKIQAQCAIRCVSQFGITNSSPDSLFYREAVQLPLVIYRPIEDLGKRRVELQAYVQISPLFILKQIPALGFMIFLWVLMNGIMWSVYWYWPKYKERMLAKNKTIEIQTVVEKKVVEVQKYIPINSFTKTNVFPAGFQFDKRTGLLNYNDQTVQLTGQKLKLFCYFLDMKQPVLTYEDIGKHMFKLDSTASNLQSRISMAIVRLRDSLAPFPFIQIEAIRGTGYQLVITQSEISEEN